jgi:putative membrane protein
MQRVMWSMAIACVSLAGCGKKGASPAPAPSRTAAPANRPAAAAVAPAAAPASAPAAAPAARPAPVSTSPLTDANIAAIVVAANESDIGYGRLAAARSTNPRVKQFAEQMQKDHGGVNTLASQLVTRLRLAPQDNAVSLDLRDQAEAVRDTLRELDGPAFDQFYAENEVRYHASLLETIEGTLVPAARNAELRALLEQVLPTVRAHFRLALVLRDAVARP